MSYHLRRHIIHHLKHLTQQSHIMTCVLVLLIPHISSHKD